MNALFYFSAYHFGSNMYHRYLLTVPDGPHDRYAVALDKLREWYPSLSNWNGTFVCLTKDDVIKDL